jgi:hypothetical protein
MGDVSVWLIAWGIASVGTAAAFAWWVKRIEQQTERLALVEAVRTGVGHRRG